MKTKEKLVCSFCGKELTQETKREFDGTTHLENRNNFDAANKINDFFSQSKVSQMVF